jgi:hypothetical protein
MRPSKLTVAGQPGTVNDSAPIEGTASASIDSREPPQPTPAELAELAELGRLLSQARASLSSGDIAAARESLEQASSLARRPAHQQLLARLARLTDYVDGFWRASRRGLDHLEPGDVFRVGGTEAMVVEKSETRMLVFREGKHIEYLMADLSDEMLIAMANHALGPDSATSKIHQGAMMAVDEEYSSEQARKLWQAAAETGSTDLGDLPRVLDDRYDLLSD